MNEDWCEHFVIFYEQLTFIILKLYRNFYVLYEQDKKNIWLYSFCKNNQFKPKKEVGIFFVCLLLFKDYSPHELGCMCKR